MKARKLRKWKMWACLGEYAENPAVHLCEATARAHAQAGATVFNTKCAVFPVEVRELPTKRRRK